MARRHPLMLCFCYPLLLLALIGGGKFTDAPAAFVYRPPTQTCESAYDGITRCLHDGGDIHVIIIDLDNPYIRFEMVMADDVTDVDTTRKERVEDMVTRPPYQDQNVVVATNADYFGSRHGPEGLSVKNGQRLDVHESASSSTSGSPGVQVWEQNPNALWRSSLAISRFNQVSLGRKTAQELSDPRVYRERFYNAVGGGPLILNYGVVVPNIIACPLERFPVGACRRKIQTVAGLSEDGRRLYLAVGEGRDVEGFARLLRDQGAFTAIKLDGGGSSQLWYDGQMRYDSDRPVGNALFVFYEPLPRHDARLVAPAQFPVVEPGEQVEIGFEIQNSGFLDWEPDLGYRFKNVQGWPVLGPAYQRLVASVPDGASLATSLSIVAPQRPGVYEAEWQFTHRIESIGPRMWFGLLVLPPGGKASGLKEQLEAQLAEWHAQPGSEQEWPALRRELERMIWREAETQLRAAWCNGDGYTGMPIEVTKWSWWAPLLRALAC